MIETDKSYIFLAGASRGVGREIAKYLVEQNQKGELPSAKLTLCRGLLISQGINQRLWRGTYGSSPKPPPLVKL